MNPTLRNKLVGAIVGGSGAITIAAVMLGNADGLEGRRYYAYQDVVGVWTVCDGHTGTDITATPTKNAITFEVGSAKSGRFHRPADQGSYPPTRAALYLYLQRWLWCFLRRCLRCMQRTAALDVCRWQAVEGAYHPARD